jgi:hypothetical protein
MVASAITAIYRTQVTQVLFPTRASLKADGEAETMP